MRKSERIGNHPQNVTHFIPMFRETGIVGAFGHMYLTWSMCKSWPSMDNHPSPVSPSPCRNMTVAEIIEDVNDNT